MIAPEGPLFIFGTLAGIALLAVAMAWAESQPSPCKERLVEYDTLNTQVTCSAGARAEVVQQGDKLFLRCACPAAVLQEGTRSPP